MPQRHLTIAIVLPVYNHLQTVGAVMDAIIETFPSELLVVVNDGSGDGTASAIAATLALHPLARIVVCEHQHNRGKGAALLTGFRTALEAGCTHALAIDADGQHRVEDAMRLLAIASLFPDDLIIGDRQFDRFEVPKSSRHGRDMSRFWLWLQTGIDIPDPQCGLRVYPLNPTLAVQCLTHRYDFETEITSRLAWRGARVRSAAISCLYFPPEQRVSHYRPWIDTMRGTWINIVLTTARILPLPLGRTAPVPAPYDMPPLSRLWDRRYWRSMLNLNGCRAIEPSLTAAAVGIGVLIAFIPIYGLQSILAIYIARRLHLNLPLMVLATQVSFPPLSIGIILISMATGHLLLHGALPPVSIHAIGQRSAWHWLMTFTADLFVGGIACGLIAGTAALLITRLVFRFRRRQRLV